MDFDPDGEEADKIIAKIGMSGARLVYLALGAPKQERFAARAQLVLPGVGFLSIGAGLNFISGAQVWAPEWVRAIATEWIWRLAMNPRRLAARYGASMLALRAIRTRRS
jgi:N-acetylglucosaminyldiphosphoundecaprenol N-acetyl-beta-D-mannosaminyltransferase